MKVQLTLGERFAVLGILPNEGTFATLKIIRKLREQLSLTEDEIKEYNVRQEENNLMWDASKALDEKEFEFGEFSEDLIVKKLKEIDKDEKLTEQQYPIYEKFIKE